MKVNITLPFLLKERQSLQQKLKMPTELPKKAQEHTVAGPKHVPALGKNETISEDLQQVEIALHVLTKQLPQRLQQKRRKKEKKLTPLIFGLVWHPILLRSMQKIWTFVT